MWLNHVITMTQIQFHAYISTSDSLHFIHHIMVQKEIKQLKIIKNSNNACSIELHLQWYIVYWTCRSPSHAWNLHI